MKIDLEKCLHDCFEKALNEIELTNGMALKEAIEKQIPEKPVIPFDSVYQEYECPKCPHRVDKTQRYCDKCGQALDWGDAE